MYFNIQITKCHFYVFFFIVSQIIIMNKIRETDIPVEFLCSGDTVQQSVSVINICSSVMTVFVYVTRSSRVSSSSTPRMTSAVTCGLWVSRP